MTPELKEMLEGEGYVGVCEVNDEVVGLRRFIYTVAICCGMDEWGYNRRYCYHDANQAAAALLVWKVNGEAEPADYIKRK